MTRRNIFTHVSIDSAPLKLPVGSVMVCDLAGNSTIWGVSINHAKEAARMNPEAFSRDPFVGPARSAVQMASVSRSHVRLLGAGRNLWDRSGSSDRGVFQRIRRHSQFC